MYTKAKIFNLALGALLLQRQITDPETTTSNEANVLRTYWDIALTRTLEDLDLDSTMSRITLSLITADPNDTWLYAYEYPANCAFLRRIESSEIIDNRTTHIPKSVGMYEGDKAIFTNQEDAVAECIVNDFPLGSLSASAGMALAYNLASLCAPLIVGKGAQRLQDKIDQRYTIHKADAQEGDRRENFNFVDETVESEFVEARLE